MSEDIIAIAGPKVLIAVAGCGGVGHLHHGILDGSVSSVGSACADLRRVAVIIKMRCKLLRNTLIGYAPNGIKHLYSPKPKSLSADPAHQRIAVPRELHTYLHGARGTSTVVISPFVITGCVARTSRPSTTMTT